MTISDCIAQLKRIMDKVGSSAQVKVCAQYNSTAETFDAFEIRKPIEGQDVYIVPTDIWMRRKGGNNSVKEAKK